MARKYCIMAYDVISVEWCVRMTYKNVQIDALQPI